MPTPTIGSLLANLTREPGRPRLTWYGPDGERVELSGAVLENWVNKTANLLVEEFDAGPGTRVLLDLPPHWRTVVWALAVWRVGACVVLRPAADDDLDVVVTTDPHAHPGADELVVVSLPALARRYDGELPAGAIDAAAAVMTYGDAIGWAPAVDGGAIALVEGGGAATSHAELGRGTAADVAWPPRSRTLIRATSLPGCLVGVLSSMRCDGSLVLASTAATAAWETDGRLRSVLDSEHVTWEQPRP